MGTLASVEGKGFTSSMEDDIFNNTVYEEIRENIPYNEDKRIEDYFQSDLLNMFEFKYSGGLNIIFDDTDPAFKAFRIRDLATLFKKDFTMYAGILFFPATSPARYVAFALPQANRYHNSGLRNVPSKTLLRRQTMINAQYSINA
jgi:hypothetical protein